MPASVVIGQLTQAQQQAQALQGRQDEQGMPNAASVRFQEAPTRAQVPIPHDTKEHGSGNPELLKDIAHSDGNARAPVYENEVSDLPPTLLPTHSCTHVFTSPSAPASQHI